MPSSTGTVVFNDSRIKATGVIATENIGVGTANPTSNLHVVGDASIQSNLEVGTASLFVDTTTGNVGVGTTNPYTNLHIKRSDAPSGTITADDYYLLLGQNENGVGKEWRIGFGYNISTTNVPPAYIGYHEEYNSSSTYGDLVFGARTSATGSTQATEHMRITHDGNVGIGVVTPAAKLHVNGGITKTQYNPGEVIETLQGRANGRSITVLSGTYTPTDVTALQNATTSHVVINGSSISYKPPAGTTRVIYEFWCFMRQTDAFPILHFAGRVAGTQVTDSRHTWRHSTSGGTDYQTWIYNNMTLTIGEVASDSLAAGQLASWTTNKTIDFTFREYSATYEGRLHMTNHWNGGGTDIAVKPVIKITAIA